MLRLICANSNFVRWQERACPLVFSLLIITYYENRSLTSVGVFVWLVKQNQR